MAKILRKIRKNKFSAGARPDWLEVGALQADALADLRTTGNCLSVWRVEDDTVLRRVVAAMAASCDSLANFDYALLPEDMLRNIFTAITKSDGDTPDEAANQAYHLNVCQISHDKLIALAMAIQDDKRSERLRMTKSEVRQAIAWALERGYLRLDVLSEGIKKHFPVGTPFRKPNGSADT